MTDPALSRILKVIHETAKRSPKRALIVASFLHDPFRSYKAIGEEYGLHWSTVWYHLHEAAYEHPEVGRMLGAVYRREVVRKDGQKRKVKQ